MNFVCHYLTIVIMTKFWLCKNISLLSIRSGIDLKIKFFYFSPGKAYSTPLTTDQKQFSSVRNPYIPRGREVWTGSDAQTTPGFIIWLPQRSLQLWSWGGPPSCCCAQSLHVCPADSLSTERVVKKVHVKQCFLAKDWARVLHNIFWSSRRQEVVQCCVTNKKHHNSEMTSGQSDLITPWRVKETSCGGNTRFGAKCLFLTRPLQSTSQCKDEEI